MLRSKTHTPPKQRPCSKRRSTRSNQCSSPSPAARSPQIQGTFSRTSSLLQARSRRRINSPWERGPTTTTTCELSASSSTRCSSCASSKRDRVSAYRHLTSRSRGRARSSTETRCSCRIETLGRAENRTSRTSKSSRRCRRHCETTSRRTTPRDRRGTPAEVTSRRSRRVVAAPRPPRSRFPRHHRRRRRDSSTSRGRRPLLGEECPR
mmetsp:Transcript_862/g.2259  ORF Transcript_862/g.2259 Transcript_862/m.2259 type:complete len:208 (+) Transcript_862:272-895(+)